MTNRSKKPRLVFDFIRPPARRLAEVAAGNAPRESLLGYIQLQERGWPVSASDDRWDGLLGRFRQSMHFKLEIPSLQMIKHWRTADIIVMITRISLVLAIIAKLLGKKIVFLDAMCEEVPKHFWRRWTIKIALNLSDACICLSASQAEHWARKLHINKELFSPVFYGVDPDFYILPSADLLDKPKRPYLLTVGRDPRRDFSTLVSAIDKLGWELKLVTQPYLVPEGVKNNPKVQILDGLSYEELFKLYANATIAVIPVKHGTTFMSGIRATMEAMLLGIPVIASSVSGMQDYFSDGKELIYFEPENSKSLVQAIQKISNDDSLKNRIVTDAGKKTTDVFSMSNYVDSLEKILQSVYNS